MSLASRLHPSSCARRFATVSTFAGAAAVAAAAGLLSAPSASATPLVGLVGHAAPTCYFGVSGERPVTGAARPYCPAGSPFLITATQLVSSANPAYAGTAVSLTAHVVESTGGAAYGTVAFSANGVQVGSATLSGGTATLVTSSLPVGQYPIVAAFSGNAVDLPSQATVQGEVDAYPLQLTQGNVNFGSTPVGVTAAPQVTILNNTGTRPWYWAGDTSSDLAFAVNPSANLYPTSCTALGVYPGLQPGQSCAIETLYTPTTTGTSSGTITVTGTDSNGIPVRLTIAATGRATPLTPAVTGVSPNSGPAAGGTTVTVSGVNLAGATFMTIGGKRISFSCSSVTTCSLVTPKETSGAKAVRVTTAAGTSASSRADIFTAH